MRLARPLTVLALALPALGSCTSAGDQVDYGDPTERNAPTTDSGITTRVLAPSASDSIPTASVELQLSAYTQPAEALTVRAGTLDSGEELAQTTGAPGPGQIFRVTVPLLHGANTVQVGVENADASKFRRLSYVVMYEGAAPGLAFRALAPGPGGGCDGATELAGGVTSLVAACVRGVVSTASGRTVATVELSTDKGGASSAKVSADGSFEAIVPLAKDTVVTILGKATDNRGASTTARRTVVEDAVAPTLVVLTPPPGKPFYTDETTVTLTGTASDVHGLASLRIDAPGGYSQSIPLAAAWSQTISLSPGKNDLTVVARDLAGNEASVPVTVIENRIIHLSAPKPNQGATQLSLDKNALSSLIAEADQKTLIMAEVSLRPAIASTLSAIRDPEKHGVDTTQWGAPEANMNRLLNMTPDNSNLKGSSVEELLGIATAVGLPPPRLLGELLGIDVTTTVVDLDTATDVLMAQVVGTHPNVDKDAMGNPVLRVSMYDVFQDLHTIGPRFGPVGMHPGFLIGDTESKVLQPGFAMSLPVKSNLTQYEGVDASNDERAALFLLAGDQVLELDFTSSAFAIDGLTDEPSMDLNMKITENPAFLSVGKDKGTGADATRPGFYRGDSAVWQIPPWQIESVIAEVGYRQNVELNAPTYQKTLTYDAGSIKNAASIAWDRGWVTITTAGGIGSPPAPQYAWDLLMEVAQIRLHDGGVPEGQANLGFTLKGLALGLTADDLIAKVKPSLQGQSAKLSKLIAGSGGLATSACDFYYVPATGGTFAYLFFRAPSDAAGSYAYTQPGFFGDASLTQKVSAPGPAPGTTDTTHEKLAVSPGIKAFFQDDASHVYSLEVVSTDADGVNVRVIPAGAM